MKRVISTSVLFLLISCFKTLEAQEVKEFDFETLIGKKASTFEGITLDNAEFNFSTKKGKRIMLVFWSKYCGGCNKEIPDLNRIIKENREANFELISVIDESKEELTNNDTTEFSLRIFPIQNDFYEYNRPIFKNKKIDFEIITNGLAIREVYGIPNSSPIILFIDEDFIIQDYNRAYYVYDNYEHLNTKLIRLLNKYDKK